MICRWILLNSRSILFKRPELEILMWQLNPDIVCITESWLTADTFFELPKYISIRQDRPNGRGGGVLLLVRKEISFHITNSFTHMVNNLQIDVASITVQTFFGKTQITTLYAPPGGDIPPNEWKTIFGFLPNQVNHIFCGDFNAHHTSWGNKSTNLRGFSLETFILDSDLFVTNDSTPTRFRDANVTGSNLDLNFCSPTILQNSSINVVQDNYNSDHLPVLLNANIIPNISFSPSNKFCLKSINWANYRSDMDYFSLEITTQFSSETPPANIYKTFIEYLKQCLFNNGAFIPKNNSLKSISKPLWWNTKCDEALNLRRENYRWYQANQSLTNREEFKRRDAEIKRTLREQKSDAFKNFCENMSASRGMSSLWRTVRALYSRSDQRNTNILIDLTTQEHTKFCQDLIREDI